MDKIKLRIEYQSSDRPAEIAGPALWAWNSYMDGFHNESLQDGMDYWTIHYFMGPDESGPDDDSLPWMQELIDAGYKGCMIRQDEMGFIHHSLLIESDDESLPALQDALDALDAEIASLDALSDALQDAIPAMDACLPALQGLQDALQDAINAGPACLQDALDAFPALQGLHRGLYARIQALESLESLQDALDELESIRESV